jgi:hypothetical protein
VPPSGHPLPPHPVTDDDAVSLGRVPTTSPSPSGYKRGRTPVANSLFFFLFCASAELLRRRPSPSVSHHLALPPVDSIRLEHPHELMVLLPPVFQFETHSSDLYTRSRRLPWWALRPHSRLVIAPCHMQHAHCTGMSQAKATVLGQHLGPGLRCSVGPGLV